MAREERAKKIKLETGTVYQNEPGGSFYFRYQINGSRKCVALKTKNEAEAVEKAKETLPIVKGRTIDVISAHVKEARGLIEKKLALPLSGVWDVYNSHPDRATPATMHEHISYHATLDEFITFCKDSSRDIQVITPEGCLFRVCFSVLCFRRGRERLLEPDSIQDRFPVDCGWNRFDRTV